MNVDEDVRLLALHNNSLEMIGIGAAFENMWLAAVSLGYSATLMVDVAVAEKKIAPMLGIRGDLVGVLAMVTVRSMELVRRVTLANSRLNR